MMKVNSLAAALSCCAFVGLAACGGGGGGKPDASTACAVSSDCPAIHDSDGGTRAQVCISQTCTPVCNVSAQCATGQVCEDGTCTAPGCGSAADCGANQICSGGTCHSAYTASDVKSCDVTPNPAVVDKGKTVKVSVVAKDANGKAIPFTGFTFASTAAGSVDTTGLVTGNAAGAATITATAGSTNCTGTVNVYDANTTAGVVRVVVINEFSKQPVVGAKVAVDIADAAHAKATDASGTASFTVAAGLHDVHVFATGYDYLSIIQTANTDILVPLMPHVDVTSRGGFSGKLIARCPDANPGCSDPTFATLNIPGESVHLAFFGSGVPGSPIDIGVQTLIGQLRPVTITLANTTKTVNLPSGLVLGVSDNMFGTETYKIYAESGKRVLWSIGGNLNLTSVVSALGPILSGGTTNIDVGSLLASLLPLFGKLQAGQIVGVDSHPENSAFTSVSVPLNTPLRLRAVAKVPDLPKQDGKYLGAAVVLGGSADYPLGYIPLGFTAGLADKDASSNNLPKVIDPTCDTSNGTAPCATSQLPIRLAPGNNGLENTKWGFIALAANLSGLSLGGTGTSGVGSLSLSGLVKNVDTINYQAPPSNGQQVDLSGRAFMALPNSNSATLTVVGRQLAMPAVDATAKFLRVGVESHSKLNWNLWMPAGSAGGTYTLPDPHAIDATFVDPLTQTVDPSDNSTGGPTGLYLAVSLSSGDFPSVSGFGNVTLDALGNSIDAFTLMGLKVQ